MKLADLKTDTETITLIHPEIGETDLIFTVCSPMSREFNQRTARLVREPSDDAMSDWIVNQALCAVVGWDNIDDEDGKAIEFSEEKLTDLLRDPSYFWMAVCVDEYLGKKKGYLQMLTNRLKHSQK